MAVLLKQRWNYLNQGVFYTKSLEKNASHLLRETFLRSIPWKENWWPEKRPYQYGSPVRIVYDNNFNNFFQMTMHFLACVVTILRKLHFTRNYIFTLNISAEELLPQCNYNPSQNIWHKVKKCSKNGQDFKNLISNFACFLTAFVNV